MLGATMLTRKKALEICRDLWIEMRDTEKTNCFDKSNIMAMWGLEYKHSCPCCEYVIQQFNDMRCNLCPLASLWGPSARNRYRCMGELSPYRPFEFDNGTPYLANKIVEACEQELENEV
jgi:hypothetical protein